MYKSMRFMNKTIVRRKKEVTETCHHEDDVVISERAFSCIVGNVGSSAFGKVSFKSQDFLASSITVGIF